MDKGCGDQNTSSKMLSTKEERRWDTKSRELQNKNWEGTGRARYEQNDKKATDVEGKIVVGLSFTSRARCSPGEAAS